jgi:tetratricopeptide (TPR) repeat protein
MGAAMSLRPLSAPPSRSGSRRIRNLLMMTCLAWCETPPWQIAAARAESATVASSTPAGDANLSADKAGADIRASRAATAARPADEAPVRNLIDALVRAGHAREALAEADRFAGRAKATAALRAQRAYLRRQLGDVAGAIEDFAAALKGSELSTEQRRNVEAGLAEARAAESQGELDRAQNDLARGEFVRAAEEARLILESHPDTESAMRIRIEALTGAGQKREALADADLFVRRGATSSLLRAQRGFLRREFNDLRGAAEDFTVALRGDGLAPEQRRNLEAGLAEAQAAQAQGEPDPGDAALNRRDYDAALAASGAALQRNSSSEAAMRVRIEALIRLGRGRDAATEADRFMAQNPASAALRAQRGYLRRGLHDTAGAIEDFTSALAGDGLSDEQRRNVEAAFAEAQTAQQQGEYDRAQAALARRDFKAASGIAERILRRDPNSEAAMRLRIDALSRAGRTRDAQAATDRLIARGHAPGWVYAQRGFTRLDAGDSQGAVQDFDAALGRGDIDRRSVANIRYARAAAAAMLAEREGKPTEAEAAYREFLRSDPGRADAWYKLGYLLLKQGRRAEAADALAKGLEIRPVGTAYPDAANAYIFASAPRASKLYREGLDRWYAGDASLAGRPATEFERLKNEVVEADASIRTTMAAGIITARPEAAGGTNKAVGMETRVRFDGRYLPAVPGLEAFARGLSGKDANGITETEGGIGLRYRPIRDLNLYFGGIVDHFFQPNAKDEFVLTWGLGLGADAYPYLVGWKPYWDFGTFGTWRTADARVLEDVRGNAGFMYELSTPIRAAVGPTLLAVAGYDNQASTPLAAGIGPSLLSYFWLGGDKYRSYDAIVSVQVGYLLNIGHDERQRGWRAQIGVTF